MSAALFVDEANQPAWGETRPHPAKFNAAILAELARLIWLEAHRIRRSRRPLLVFDPFAGVGRLQWVGRGPMVRILCGDLEPEWIGQAPDGGMRSDATAMPFPAESVDVIATSVVYANRMSDLYDGRDGSRRHTYRIDLGRLPSPGSSCGMQWGPEYQQLHIRAWRESFRVLRPGGALIVNIKDHQRDKEWQRVPQWHESAMGHVGFDIEEILTADAPGLRDGSNADARAEDELIIVGRKPGP